MICWLRDVLYAVTLIVAAPWLLWRSWQTGRYRSGWQQKLLGSSPDVFAPLPLQARPLVWLHGVSVGEVQLLKPLLDSLRNELPRAGFAVSTTTVSGMHVATRLMPKDVALFYFPLDFSWAIRRTLRSLQPTLIILGELELWPNLIDIASFQQVPIVVMNGRLSSRSHKRYRRFSWLTRSMFSKLNLVAAQSPADAERFHDCGVTSPVVTGSVKFDTGVADRESPQVCHLRQLIGIQPEHRLWIAGSTQAPEEAAAAAAWMKLNTEFENLKLVVVPRHPQRFEAVYRELARSGARVVRRSQLTAGLPADDWDIVLVDTLGELKYWWGLAEIALVGGSFGSRGGQNMLEPAAFGANVAFGPHTSNFKDITELLLAGDAATRLPSLSHLEDWLRGELHHPAAGRARGERAQCIIANQRGALRRTVELVLGQLQPGTGQAELQSDRSAELQ